MTLTINFTVPLFTLILCAVSIMTSCASGPFDDNKSDVPEWVTQIANDRDQGLVTYNDLLTQASFDSLRSHPLHRKHFRALLLTLVDSPDGFIMGHDSTNKIEIKGKVIDESSQEGLPGVQIEFVQTDANGLYFDDDTLFNPLHYGFVRTNDTGAFRLIGSLPGHYPYEDKNTTPRHTHFNISTPGYRPYYGEFNYSDDSVLQILIAEGKSPGDPVAHRVRDSSGMYMLTIPLQPIDNN